MTTKTMKKVTKSESIKKERGLPDRFSSDPKGIKFVEKKSTKKEK